MVEGAILRTVNLTAREVFSQKALSRKLNELENQERRDKEQLASRIKNPGNELDAA